MIFFEQPTPNGIIFAKKKHADESTSVIATCDNTKDKRPELHGSWEMRNPKMNSLAQVAFTMSLANAYATMWHACVLRDVLETRAEVLAQKD
jgi:hypothetical protein